ncbi:MAG TPA: alkaline phosphatase family protein [Actinomycetota bacterium]|nr:alkaline phosphatase family protein [Actinomycetota bacterium]
MSSSNGGPRHAGPVLVITTMLVTLVSACSSTPVSVQGLPGPEQMARRLGSDVVGHLARGYVSGRSGEILLVPEPWNVLGNWTGGVRGVDDPRTTHATPWSYHQRVPLILYGPGFVRAGLRPERPVDVADLAPTFAELMRFRFEAPDGRPLREALRPDLGKVPRAIVVVVYDGGGWNLLEQWPDAWPVQRRLAEAGTMYVNATVGSSPSLTAPVHSTIGTGAYPRVHGIVENTARMPDGSIGDVYGEDADPSLLEQPTLADVWDRTNGDRPWVGMLGTEGWHLGMLGSGGSSAEQDVAVLWSHGRETFWTNEDRYRLPDYLPGPEVFRHRTLEIDGTDGALDGRWRGNILSADTYAYTGSPAFASYQGDAAIEILRREPIGEDRLTDLFFVEMKTTDVAGHVWNMLGPESEEVLRAQDRVLGALLKTLDEEIGRNRYVVAMTADHGQTPRPDVSGGLRVDRNAVLEDVNEAFGEVVEAVHPSDLFLDMDAVRAEGVSVEVIARFLGDYRYGEGLPDGTDEDAIPEAVLNRRVFAAAIPGSFIQGLTEGEIAALGPGSYAESDLTTPPAIPSFAFRAAGGREAARSEVTP